ncbi:anti-sigma B factor antagonist [Actinoplanes octamycinicus]|uniref:Anti-sigma factor antagonist n=1 Tax=Actinoplanes octamycinicus TaxID=135948 RepID=A0A7W7MBH0_9ACTN|nr:STAS domain-containing protein [Actinoplanes octamycinicus]MBB4744017.1 anti-sigma B factor antagonist [Actinoplanes octamycinicus]GIE58642.1 anti-sigma factor antagonist [Actinoplanes octamycinicus]
MNITSHHGDDQVRIALTGELDMATTEQLRAHLDHTLISRPRLVLVDLDGVTFCDSTGISALVAARTAAAAAGSHLQVVNAHGITAKTMQITGVLEFLTTPPGH